MRDGWFPAPNNSSVSSSLMDRAVQGEDAARAKEEEEDAERERKEEEDDEGARAEKMGMDEYRDTHRRGWGNRHNMG